MMKKFNFHNMVFMFDNLDVMGTREDYERRLSFGRVSISESGETMPLKGVTRASPRTRKLYWLLIYLRTVVAMDRGIAPATIGNIMEDLGINSTEAGSLNSVYIIGLVCMIPICTHMSTRVCPFRILSIGLLIWIASAIGTGLSQTYWQMMIFRTCRGAGDAVFQITALPWIDRKAPPTKRAGWVALFQGVFVLGISIGTMSGGAFATSRWEWRGAFLLVAMLTIVPTIICLFVGEPPFVESDDSTSSQEASDGHQALWSALRNPLTWISSLGFAGLMSTSVGLGYWSVVFCQEDLDGTKADCSFGIGGTQVVGAVFGTVFGGVLLDKLGVCLGGQSCALAHTLAAIGALLCMPPIFFAYYLQDISLGLFFLLFMIGIFLLMMSGAAFTPGSLWTGAPETRVGISALVAIVANGLGTAPAPIITGYFKDHVTTFRVAMLIQSGGMVIALVCWTITAILANIFKVGTKVDEETQEKIGLDGYAPDNDKMLSDQKE